VGCSAQLADGRRTPAQRLLCDSLCQHAGRSGGCCPAVDAVEVGKRGTDVVVVNMRELPASIRSSAMLSRLPIRNANFQSKYE
jgi:hypothetical protein